MAEELQQEQKKLKLTKEEKKDMDDYVRYASVEILADLVKYALFVSRVLEGIFFILFLLIWKVFLWEPINKIIDTTSKKWLTLSDNYKILILGIIGTFIAAVLAHVIGGLLLDKIKKIAKDKK